VVSEDRGKALLKQLGVNGDNVDKAELSANVGVGLGVVFVLFPTAMAIAHYGFDVPIHDKQTHGLAAPAEVLKTIVMFIAAGIAMVVAGLWVRRVCGRWWESE
jgi:hypothetical protein